MHHKIVCLFYILILTLFFNLYGQEQTIVRGTVTDVQNATLPGVSVAELDKNNRIVGGTLTDNNGNYALRIISNKNRISFSNIGFKTQIKDLNNTTLLSVQLLDDAVLLEGVNIVAKKTTSNGMMEIEERDLTTSVSKIDTKELEELQATSIDQALQGRLAGVDIVASSGDPGAGMAIRIRGTSSINSNADPLIVLDGMPYQTTVSSDFDFGTADEQSYAQLLNIAPSDIKDITVLKDAAATAMWGAQASNGVLLITTKRGKKGKPQINYSYKGSFTKQPASIPLLNGDQYRMLIPEEIMNRNGVPINTSTAKEFQNDPNDPWWYYNYGQNTNWIDMITQIGYVNDHTLSLSGGGEKTTYRASLGYNHQRGTTIGTDFTRFTARINLDYLVSEKLRFQTDLAYTHADNNRNYVNTKDGTDAVRTIAYAKMPNMSVYEYTADGVLTPNYLTPASNIQGAWPKTYNPYALAKEAKNEVIGDRIVPHFSLNYNIVPSLLKFTTDIGFDINNSKTNMFLPQIATGVDITNSAANKATDSDVDGFTVQTISKLLITPNFGESHKLFGLVMLTSNDYRESDYGAATTNLASSELEDPSIASLTGTTGSDLQSSNSQNRSVGALANVQYSLFDRYIINAGLRGDGSSKLSSKQRYGFFPSISGRWRFSDEPFMRKLKFINDLSFTASYGESGNAPKSSYGYFGTYNSFSWNYQGSSGIYPSSMELQHLKWETVIQTDFGVRMELLNNRFTVDYDYYRKRTKDMFYSGLQISTVSGFDNMDMNVGVMDNQGWELNMNADIVKTKDFRVSLNFNIAHNENVIRSISEFYPLTTGNMAANGNYLVTIQKNNPFGSFYGYRYKGVYKNDDETTATDRDGNKLYDPLGNAIKMKFYYPQVAYAFQAGDAKYEDINHDGNINYMDVVLLGDANPRFTGGFGSSFSYRNWKLSTFFHFRYKNDIVNQTRINTEKMTDYSNQSTAVLRRWRKEGDETDIPRALYGSGYNWLGSDRFVEDGSFIRLKSVTLFYNVKKDLSRFGISNLNFFFTAENLITWTKYTGQDPEVSLNSTTSNPFAIGYDNAMTPPVKTFTLGMSVQL